MKVQKTPVVRYPYASKVTVSRTKDGCWIIDRFPNRTTLPPVTFANWDEAQWTGTVWANEEHEARRNEEE